MVEYDEVIVDQMLIPAPDVTEVERLMARQDPDAPGLLAVENREIIDLGSNGC